MRLSLTSVILYLPLASLAALDGGSPEGDTGPTTTLESTITMTITQSLEHTTITSVMVGDESPLPVISSAPDAEVPLPEIETTSEVEVVTEAAPAPSPSTFQDQAPYPIPGTTVAAPVGSGTVAPTGTGVSPPPEGIAPFEGAASRIGSQAVFSLVVVAIAGLILG